jgi:dephospho-CoA kinase
MKRETPVYGLTGNMGCGKSTVAKFFSEFSDVVVIDADEIVKELLHAEENLPKLEELFGPEVFTDGRIDAKKLGQLVFSDRRALMKLEDFIHPLVQRETLEKTIPRPGISFFLVEAALIYETGWQNFFNAVIVVTCGQAEQYRRLRETRGLSDEEISKRLFWQIPNEEKARRANFIVNTDCPLEEVKKQVRNLYRRLKNGA